MSDKHHFLPQFYLKNFVDPGWKYSGEPYLWQVELATGKIAKHHPRNVAYVRGYNEWTRINQHLEPIEGTYSRFESEAAPLIRALIAGKYGATGRQRHALAWFIALQMSRVPSVRAELRLTASELLQTDIDTSAEGLLPDFTIQTTSDSSTVVSEATLRLSVDPEDHHYSVLDNPRDYIIIRSMQLAGRFVGPIYAAKWLVMIASKDRTFFTTDTSVVFETSSLIDVSRRMYFPLSPRHLLLMEMDRRAKEMLSSSDLHGKVDPHVETMRVNKLLSDHINSKLLSRADRLAFTSDQRRAQWIFKAWRRSATERQDQRAPTDGASQRPRPPARGRGVD
jgi:hypothetical protein